MAVKIYDCWINNKGYRLVDGAYAFSSNIATPFAPKMVSGDPTLSDFDLYSIVAQSDFRGGIGQMKLEDFTKYLWGHRVDTRGERATLGVKLDSSQPFSTYETTGSMGKLDIDSELNWCLANEPENQVTSWFELNSTNQKIAIPFTTPSSGDVDIQRIWMYLRSQGTLTSSSTINYAIYSDSSGPNTALTNGTIAISVSDVSHYGEWLSASLTTIPTTNI
jgi:hypothetical protein